MAKQAKSIDMASPAERASKKGQKNKAEAGKNYHAIEPHGGDIAKKRETDEQPVHPGDSHG